jgi:uncharacterized protein (DUF58 family)
MRHAGGAAITGDSTPQKFGATGHDDVIVREYRQGDDVRRIHWASTARRGELMVRREEQTWDPATTVLLDSRQLAHAGKHHRSSFEWAVSAACSIALHFLDAGFRIELFDADGAMVTSDRRIHVPATRQQIITELTDVTLSDETDLTTALSAVAASQRGHLLVAVTGWLTSEDAQLLLTAQHAKARCLAFVIDPDTFVARHQRSTTAQYDAHREAIGQLREHSWRVIEVSRGDDLAQLWSHMDLMAEVL